MLYCPKAFTCLAMYDINNLIASHLWMIFIHDLRFSHEEKCV